MNNLFLFNFLVTSFMFGLIVTTQIVNYPLFSIVKSNNFSNYHSFYVNKISFIVIPVMLIEFLISILLISLYNSYLINFNFVLMVLIFLTTYLIQVPIHNAIKIKSNRLLFDKLIKTNWIRTIFWFLKIIISYNIILREMI